jgi:glycosyltransferase involved in cell wall biosynthesis
MARTRILQVITRSGVGAGNALGAGAQVVVKTVLEHIDREAFDVRLVVGNEGYLTAAAARYGVEVTVVPELRRDISPVHDARALARLWRLMRDGAFDVVHTHSTKAGVIGRVASRLAGVPVVVHTVHGMPFHEFNGPLTNRSYKLAERLAGRVSDCLICVSEKDRALAIEERIVPPARVVTIPPGIDLARYRPGPRPGVREALGLPPDGPVVGMIARLDAQKAPEDFLLAAASVLARVPDATFVLVGDGDLRARLAALAQARGLGSRFVLAGARSDVPDVLAVLDVFVLPSLWEGLPLAILEAMAMARPVVATRIPGTVEIVRDEVTGLLVPPRQPPQLAEAILSLLADTGRARAMGEEGRRRIQDGYDARSMTARIQALYLQLLGRANGAGAPRAAEYARV